MLRQQGDVLLKKLDKLPEGLKPAQLTSRGWVLAEGEATGHAHTVLPQEGTTVYVDENGELFVDSSKPFTVKHDEHKAVASPPGIWKVDKVREYDHLAEEARQVRD